jgi:hypothetical protein
LQHSDKLKADHQFAKLMGGLDHLLAEPASGLQGDY